MKCPQKKFLKIFNGILLVFFSMTILQAQDKPVAGLGSALRFGPGSYIKVNHKDIQEPLQSNWSILAWVKTTKKKCTILKKGRDENSDFYGLEIEDGKAVFHFSTGDNYKAKATGTDRINDNKWHHIAGIRAGIDSAVIFVDGILQGQGSFNREISDNFKKIDSQHELRIGNGYSEDSNFSGIMDEIHIWNIALSKERIIRYMFLPPKGDEPNLIALWRFDADGKNEIKDHSKNENLGVINGNLTRVKSSVWDTVTVNDSIFTHRAGYSPNGTPISIVEGTKKPSNGKLSFDSSAQTITYRPDKFFNGKDSYSFIVKDNSSSSDECLITVIRVGSPQDTPKVVVQPRNDTVTVGEVIKFEIKAKGQSPLIFQWQKKQPKDITWSDILPATNSSEYSFNADTSDSGVSYRCIVWNTSIPKKDTSDSAIAIIGKKPEIKSIFPKDTLIQTGLNFTLEATVEGSLPIVYKWFFTPDLKQEKSKGKDNSVIEINTASKTDSGYYYFLASNSFGSISDTILVHVLDSFETNPLVIAGEYFPYSDSAKLIISNLTKLDTIKHDSVVIQSSYSEKYDSLLSSKRLAVSELVNSKKDKYNHVIRRLGPLPLETDTVYCRCFILFKTNIQGQKKKNQFAIGNDRPRYNGRLKGDSTSSSDKVYLYWEKPDNTPDKIRIWWDTKEQIPLGREFNLPQKQVHDVASLKDTSDTLSGFMNNTGYYFGLQIFRNNMWSDITEYSRTYVKTGRGDTTDIGNKIAIDTAWFDTTTNNIRVQWHIDLSAYPEGKQYFSDITYSIGKNLENMPAPTTWNDTIKQSLCTSSVELGNLNIVFDTLYTIGIWIRSYDENSGFGTPVSPTDSSTSTIKTPDFTWKEIKLFPENKDTIHLRKNRIIFRQLSRFTTTAVIRGYKLQTDLPAGMKEVGGTPFRFDIKTDELPSFELGMKFSKHLAAGITSKNIAIYQLKSNKLYIQHDFETRDNTIWITVKPKSGMLQYPFMVLADLSAPKVSIKAKNDTIDLNSVTDSIKTIFRITDNIVNVHWNFLYNSGNKSLDNLVKDTLDTTDKVVTTFIVDNKNNIGSIISKTYGVRALFIVSDGIHKDTLDVSRCVKSDDVEYISIIPGNWIPLSTEAHLDNVELGATFNRSYSGWSYDNKNFRLFRWHPVNPNKKEHWVEYSENNKEYFTLLPGKLIWYKTTRDNFIILGRGVTLSLKKPYEKIVLKAKNWTDISNPFAFNIKLRDILKANNEEVSKNIDIYHWKPDEKTYIADPVYLGIIDFDKIDTLSDIFISNQGLDGYTILNRDSVSHNLKIPPTCIPLSPKAESYKISRRSESNNKWTIDFRWKKRGNSDQSFYKRVRIGYKNNLEKSVKFGVLPPSMNKITVGTYDSSNNAIRSWSLQKNMKNGGMIFDMAIHNSSLQDEYLDFYLDNLLFLPKEVKAAILNPDRQKYEIPQKTDSGGKQFYNGFSIPAQSRTHRMLVIGSDEYLNYAKQLFTPYTFTFIKVYPNPFMYGAKILYSIPSGTKEVYFTLYNMMGKQIHRRIEENFSKKGKQVFYFDSKGDRHKGYGPIPSGMYILQLTAINKANRIMYGGQKRIICIK
ncbi:MAG: LamG domain-containing protein [Chitinispirillia bacterium]|jgi:hypothetical protein